MNTCLPKTTPLWFETGHRLNLEQLTILDSAEFLDNDEEIEGEWRLCMVPTAILPVWTKAQLEAFDVGQEERSKSILKGFEDEGLLNFLRRRPPVFWMGMEKNELFDGWHRCSLASGLGLEKIPCAVGIPKRPAPVFVDELFTMEAQGSQAKATGARHGHKWCHLWAEDLDALHEMAQKIGMRQSWFQNRRGFPHYDLVPTRRAAAVKLGVRETSLREWIMAKKTNELLKPPIK